MYIWKTFKTSSISPSYEKSYMLRIPCLENEVIISNSMDL